MSLTAMSFNIYVGTPSEQREESVIQTIRKYLPDTLGVQEASTYWMDALEQSLGDIYEYVGEGREGGRSGEHSAIFYRKDRFDLIETGTKWLSDTPDVVSKFPESCLWRIFTYAILAQKDGGENLLVINTHLDHISQEARNTQIAILLEFMKNHEEYPIVFTGDFNDIPTTRVYELVTNQLQDASMVAHTSHRSSTFHAYDNVDAIIDYIFVSKEGIDVLSYETITDETNGMLPSDHYPIYIEYDLV